jgi:hypothetical protein
VELIYSDLNHRFDMSVIFTINYFLVGCDTPSIVTDFINLKIKSAQSFKDVHKDNMCIHIFIEMSNHMCMNICVYKMFLKKHKSMSKRKR